MLPLKRSASFKISVDRVEVEPVIKYENGLEYLAEVDEDDNIQNGNHVVINSGTLFRNGASVVQNGTSVVQNGASVVQNGTSVVQNGGNHQQNGGHMQNGEIFQNGVHENGVEEEEVDEEAPVNIISGADWESVNYTVNSFEVEDEVTGLAVSEDYIVAQFFMDPEIHVFNRTNFSLLHRLSGHDYGGQAVQILDHVLYSGSKDFSLKSWDLKKGKELATVKDHRDYVQCLCVKRIHVLGLGEDGEGTALVSGGAADHRVIVYSTDSTGLLKRRFILDGHSGWVTCIEITDTMVITGSKDCSVKLWDLSSGDLLQSLLQDAEITCLSVFNLRSGYLMFGDGESKLSLLDLATGDTIHLMPNTLVGTGRYRRCSKYHDKSVDNLNLCDNGYMVTASSGSKYIKIWKLEKYDDLILKTEVTELQILRDHSDYLNVLRVVGNSIFSCCGDGKIFIHTFPEGEQHYDMLRTQERNSVAVLFQGEKGLAPSVDQPTVVCEGRLCKAGKSGLARSSSSFQVKFSLKPTTASAEGRLVLPQTIDEDSEEDEEDEEDEYVIEYVTDSDLSDGNEEW